MRVRPKCITVISYWIIVSSLAMILLSYYADDEKILTRFHLTSPPSLIDYVLLLVNIIIGIGIFKGKNWARLFYQIGSIIILILSVLILPRSQDIGISIIQLVVVLKYLFSPEADQFFDSSSKNNIDENVVA